MITKRKWWATSVDSKSHFPSTTSRWPQKVGGSNKAYRTIKTDRIDLPIDGGQERKDQKNWSEENLHGMMPVTEYGWSVSDLSQCAVGCGKGQARLSEKKGLTRNLSESHTDTASTGDNDETRFPGSRVDENSTENVDVTSVTNWNYLIRSRNIVVDIVYKWL